MPKQPTSQPTLLISLLRLGQFRGDDTDAMHECFADSEAMRFWNAPVHTKRIETERAVRRCIDCTPSYYQHWAMADAGTDRCPGMVNYHYGHIRNKRVAIGLHHQWFLKKRLLP
jgi:[ribosomal protein S5]-alanine N-acetyltransferase